MAKRTERSTEKTISLLLVAALLAAAIVQELRKPPEERQWVGKVAGIVPYDLRRPTFQRLLAAVWSPHDSRLFMPHGFGVGWTVNVGRLVQLARRGPTGATGHDAAIGRLEDAEALLLGTKGTIIRGRASK